MKGIICKSDSEIYVNCGLAEDGSDVGSLFLIWANWVSSNLFSSWKLVLLIWFVMHVSCVYMVELDNNRMHYKRYVKFYENFLVLKVMENCHHLSNYIQRNRKFTQQFLFQNSWKKILRAFLLSTYIPLIRNQFCSNLWFCITRFCNI